MHQKIKNPPNVMNGSDGCKYGHTSVAKPGYVQKAMGSHGKAGPGVKEKSHGAATAALGSAGAKMTRSKPGRSPVAPVDKRGGVGR